VATDEAKLAVEREVERLGIPREAVIIQLEEATRFFSHTLNSYYRPIDAGYQIQGWHS